MRHRTKSISHGSDRQLSLLTHQLSYFCVAEPLPSANIKRGPIALALELHLDNRVFPQLRIQGPPPRLRTKMFLISCSF